MQTDQLSAPSVPRPEFSAVLIHLLRGPLYSQERPQLWNSLLTMQVEVKTYFQVIQLALYLDEAEGYAFLRQMEPDLNDDSVPRLIRRRPLGLAMSVLCLLLRKWLVEHDTKGGEPRVIMDRKTIHAELGLYLKDDRSEAKKADKMDKYIQQAVDWGLVRELKGDSEKLEILRITKALINAEWLGNLEERLRQYQQQTETPAEDQDNV
ncbi:MAG TPA: DUF4194 domain-containing protein [Oligoflexus sp.]|uniref:DUF4194 domain-containing protein n=1 Tax=Oligoflexus sp. TaxID=1971216 RepID=UPI002D80C430|nr:DUF4194 domain-containing protein [Oligoflexus sp.]HET9239577.1 DUF4194 domain-containing protein [Oligoflexus sp.]